MEKDEKLREFLIQFSQELFVVFHLSNLTTQQKSKFTAKFDAFSSPRESTKRLQRVARSVKKDIKLNEMKA